MGSYVAIGLLVLFYIASLFAGKLRRWRGLPIVYLAVAVYFIIAAITGSVRLYFAIAFTLVGIYGAVRSYRELRRPGPQGTETVGE